MEQIKMINLLFHCIYFRDERNAYISDMKEELEQMKMQLDNVRMEVGERMFCYPCTVFNLHVIS